MSAGAPYKTDASSKYLDIYKVQAHATPEGSLPLFQQHRRPLLAKRQLERTIHELASYSPKKTGKAFRSHVEKTRSQQLSRVVRSGELVGHQVLTRECVKFFEATRSNFIAL